MNIRLTPLLQYFNKPGSECPDFTGPQWELLSRQAKATNLLSSLAVSLQKCPGSGGMPGKTEVLMNNARRIALSSSRSVRWEVNKIYEVLAPENIPFILLKGAAYEMAKLPAAEGRLFVDVDIMVRQEDLNLAEKRFIQSGWMATKLNAYDQKYYRTWMHEIPPLRHMERSTSLDVHHTIIPPTACFKPDVGMLWASAVELPDLPGAYTLCPEDMLLHSATHLFHDGDLAGGLRDLVDLDILVRYFCETPGFLDNLVDRARDIDLLRPLYYMFRYCRKYLGTPIPDQVMLKVEAMAAPIFPTSSIMDVLVERAFYPQTELSFVPLTAFSRWLLYVRSHYLRMPLYLLLPHLVRKALSSDEER